MATIVNTPSGASDTASNSVGFLMGMVVLFAAIFFIFYYGLPTLRSSFTQPSISVPDRVDVNVDTPDAPGQ